MSRRQFLADATAFLSAVDDDWAGLLRQVGPCRLRVDRSREPYAALIHAVAHQQIHGRAAASILGRFQALYPDAVFPAPEQLLATPEDALRGCGFSAAKLAAIRDIAEKTANGVVPSRRTAMRLADEELIARLTTVRGVGRWTVEMLLMFSLGRPDILPVDDFGVRQGWKVLKRLPEQPRPRVLAQLGEAWSPYRSVAAWYLWRAAELKALPG